MADPHSDDDHGGPPPAQDRKGGEQPADGKPAAGQAKRPNPLKNPKVLAGIGIAVAVLAIGGLLYWLHARQYVKTDDAFVDTHIVRLAPQVSGIVSRVTVDDDVPVRAGQVLVVIEASSARAAFSQAQAQQGEARARLAQAQAQVEASRAAWRQAEEQTQGLAAQAAAAAQDAERLRKLAADAPRAVARQQVEDAAAQARTAEAQSNAARRQAQGALAQVRAARTAVQAAQATLGAAGATFTQSRITLGNTLIVAPVDGYVAQKTVAPGGYVQPGQELMAIVPRQMWVTANFKETQLRNMRVGQPVDMTVDACPVELHGRVASIQRGAGQAFALLPSENATGNFVKVVQRVPVKILFRDIPANCPLGPGLSVQPRVKVR